MQEIKAFKSNSGNLYETADEAKVKDLIDEVTAFTFPEDKDGVSIDYNGYRAYRRMVIEQLCSAIVKDIAKFRAIFEKIS